MATSWHFLTSLFFWCGVLLIADCFSIMAFMRHRRDTSSENTYQTSKGLNCSRCPAGFYLVSDCTTELGLPDCAECEINTYMDHANSERKCELCTTCDANGNLKENRPCFKTQNTQCICKDNFYCDNEHCKVCYECDTCENAEIQTPCSSNNNTVCKKPYDRTPVVVSVVLTLVIIISIIVFGVLWRKKLVPGIKAFKQDAPPLQDGPLITKDISSKLDQIAGVLSLKQVKRLCRQTLKEGQMENIKMKYDDPHEEAYHLLVTWHEKEGIKAYSKLLTFLNQNTDQQTTKEVKKLVEDMQVESEENETEN